MGRKDYENTSDIPGEGASCFEVEDIVVWDCWFVALLCVTGRLAAIDVMVLKH
jgi:hypothetical protein